MLRTIPFVPTSTTYAIWLVTLSALVVMRQKIHDDLTVTNSWPDSFDYVIVGAGTAGSVIARRLAEDQRNFRILLLEAGSSESISSDMPAMTKYLVGSEMDWNYKTTPQQWACYGFNDGRCPQPRGRVFGGTSVLSWMNYLRGNPRDYNNWSTEFGLKDWSWGAILPFFIKSENNTNPSIAIDNIHGINGPHPVSSVHQEAPQIFNQWLDATIENGYPLVKDLNGQRIKLGSEFTQKYMLNGHRVSSSTAFLQPIKSSKNLHIVSGAFVTQILFNDAEDKTRASGLKFFRAGNYHIVKVVHEIIVCAGAINTPHLLLLSGIGPAEHLQQFNIPIITDLPVGDNLHDHVGAFGIHFELNNQANETEPDQIMTLKNLYQWFTVGSGPLAENTQTITMVKTKLTRPEESPTGMWPDIHLETHFWSVPADFETFTQQTQMSKSVWDTFYSPYAGKKCLTVVPKLLRPKSRGWVRLQSANPFVPPSIDPQYLANPYDITVLLEGIKEALRIAMSRHLTEDVRLFVSPVPGCQQCSSYIQTNVERTPSYLIYKAKTFRNDYVRRSRLDQHVELASCDEYLACMARVLTRAGHNHVGTCRMGVETDANSVVDSRLRVKNVKSLRVVDASVMPSIVSGDIVAAVEMIAERASEMIKQDFEEMAESVWSPIASASSSSSLFKTVLPCDQLVRVLGKTNPYNYYNDGYGKTLNTSESQLVRKYLSWMSVNNKAPCTVN